MARFLLRAFSFFRDASRDTTDRVPTDATKVPSPPLGCDTDYARVFPGVTCLSDHPSARVPRLTHTWVNRWNGHERFFGAPANQPGQRCWVSPSRRCWFRC